MPVENSVVGNVCHDISIRSIFHLNSNGGYWIRRYCWFLLQLISNDSLDIGRTCRKADKTCQPPPVPKIPKIITAISEQTPIDTLLSDIRSRHKSNISSAAYSKIATPFMKNI